MSEKGKEGAAIGGRGRSKDRGLSICDNPQTETNTETKHNTQAEIAKQAKVSTGQVGKAKVIHQKSNLYLLLYRKAHKMTAQDASRATNGKPVR